MLLCYIGHRADQESTTSPPTFKMTIDDSPYDLTRVPTEIWRDIIEQACTDGGPTGKSLVLTSKFFHVQANDSRFTSLALFSLNQLERFLAFVHSRPSEWRYPVRHLWLSFAQECFNGQASIVSENDDSDEEWHARFDCAMTDLLALVAPSLRVLTLVQNDSHAVPLFRLDLPILSELTVWGSVSAVVIHPCSADCPPRLPALRRFHFVCGDPSSRAQLLGPSSWLSASPLTHLRLSDLHDGDEGHEFANTIACAIGVHMPGSSWSNAVPPQGKEIILPHLRYLWLHGLEWYPSTCSEADQKDWWEVLKSKLEEVVRVAAGDKGMWALVLEKSWRKRTVWERRLWDDWLERMEGGRGCWVESKEDENALEGPDRCKPHEGGQIWD